MTLWIQQSTTLSVTSCICKSHLAYASIRLHLAAVAAYLQTGNKSLFRVPVIKAFMKGLKWIIPPWLPPASVWNLNIVLSKLMGPPFESLHTCPLLFLFWKLALLVTITSFRQLCKIQVLPLKEPFFQVHHDKVVLRTKPKLLPKVVSSFHLNQTIKLPVFFPHPKAVVEQAPVTKCQKCFHVLHWPNKALPQRTSTFV